MPIITPNLRPDLDALRVDVAVAALRDVVKDGWTVLALSTGMADGFVDSTGIASLGGATYDGTAKTIGNLSASTSYANAGGSGNRSGSIAVTSAGTWSVAPSTGLVDGSTSVAGQAVHGASVAASGQSMVFDLGASNVVQEVRYYAGTGTAGTNWGQYKWQIAANIGGPYTDISAAFAWMSGSSSWIVMGDCSANSTAGRYLKIQGISGTSTNNSGICEFEFKLSSSLTPPAVTVVSAPFALGFQPSLARIVAPVELGGGTIGVDCFLDVSRAGSDWAPVTLADLGKFDTSTRIVGGIASLSALAAGTDLYWRWRTGSNYTSKCHGIWLQAK